MVHQRCAFLRECGFKSAHFAAECSEGSGPMLTTNAVQVAGLGRIYFGLLQPMTTWITKFRHHEYLETRLLSCA